MAPISGKSNFSCKAQECKHFAFQKNKGVTSLWTTCFLLPQLAHVAIHAENRDSFAVCSANDLTSNKKDKTFSRYAFLSCFIPHLCFCSKLTSAAKSKADGSLTLQQMYYKSWGSDRRSEGYHQSNRIMSHREIELHSPHFISARLRS